MGWVVLLDRRCPLDDSFINILSIGHARPICTFAAKVVLSRHIHVTFFTPLRVVDRIKTEIDRNFDASDVEKRKFIRYVMEADLSVFRLCDVTVGILQCHCNRQCSQG